MNKFNSITIALILLSVPLSLAGTALAESSESFPDEEWNRTYSLGEVDNSLWIEQTSDGGYIAIGSRSDFFREGKTYSGENVIVKTDTKGELQWSRKFIENDKGRPDYIKQTYVMQTSDNGYLITGSTENSTTGNLNIWVRKLDAQGIEQWKKDFTEDKTSRQFFGGNNLTDRYNEAQRSILEIRNAGFIIIGRTYPCQNCSNEKEGPMDIWLKMIDHAGNEIWNRTLGRTDMTAFSIAATNDGGFILAGVSENTIWFNKSEPAGNELWTRKYEGIAGRSVVIRQVSDSGYVAAIADPSGSQIMLMKTDHDGRKMWEKKYKYNSFNDFLHTRDGGFLLWRSDWAKSSLLKLDQEGKEQWRRDINDLVISYLEQTRNGDYLISATKLSDDVILGYTVEKLNSMGNKLWEKIFGNEFSWSLSVNTKTISETSDGFIVMGSAGYGRHLKLKKFKNREIPFAVFTYEPEYPGVNKTIIFDASISNDPKGNITNYKWDFGDENTTVTSAKRITHSFTGAGEFIVRLTIINNTGGVNSTWKKVLVQKLASPDETLNVSLKDFNGVKYVDETADHGFIIAGGNNSISKAWLLKTDPGGQEQWNWTVSGMELKSVIQTQDNGFLASGEIGMSDIQLIKIDQNGDEQWNRIFAGKGIAPYLSFGIVFGENGTVAQTHDGGYVIAGINRKAGGELWDAWLMKIDAFGNESWSRILKGNRNGQNTLSSVMETSDGGYIVAGTWWNPYGGPDPEAIFIRTDQEGNEKWTWTSGNTGINEAGSSIQTPDGDFVMMGTSSNLNKTVWDIQTGPLWDTDIWLVKTDARGIEKWRRNNRVKSLVWETSLSVTKEGGYVYSVIAQERPEKDYEYDNSFNVKFLKLDPDGNIEWQKRDEGLSIRPTSDGGYVTARDSMLIKFGGVKSEPKRSDILVTANQTYGAAENYNQTVTTVENAAGFEVVLVLCVLVALFAAGRKRRLKSGEIRD